MKTIENYNSMQLPGVPGFDKMNIRSITIPKIGYISTNNLKVEKVELSDEYTRIDIIHYADSKYISGGWVHICPEIFIRVSGSSQRLGLINVLNVPIARAKYYYRHINDRISFSLFFSALPNDVKSFDMIEKLNGGGNYFNIYGISAREIDNGPIQLGSISFN